VPVSASTYPHAPFALLLDARPHFFFFFVFFFFVAAPPFGIPAC
jgi:hypothetical protein